MYNINSQDPTDKPLIPSSNMISSTQRSKTPVRSNGTLTELSKRRQPSPLHKYNSFRLYDNKGDLASTDRERSQNNVSLDTVQSEAEEPTHKAVAKILSPSSSEKSAAWKKLGTVDNFGKGNDSARDGRKSAGRTDNSPFEHSLSNSKLRV